MRPDRLLVRDRKAHNLTALRLRKVSKQRSLI